MRKATELSPQHSESTCESSGISEERLSLVDRQVGVPPVKEDFCKASLSDYAFGKVLGHGAYGEVRVAREMLTGRMVAVKQIKVLFDEHRVGIEREISAMKELNHPNTCKIFATVHAPRPCFAFRFNGAIMRLFDYVGHPKCKVDLGFFGVGSVAGFPSASRRMWRTKQRSRTAASALHYAHSCGIVHRDVKPENLVFVSFASTRIKVIDWGLCCPLSETHAVAGSLCYAAPELIMAKVTNGKICRRPAVCDTWSLGVVIMVMLSGKLPFRGSPQEQLQQMQSWHQRSLRDHAWLAMFPEAKDLITGMLKIDPWQRPTVGSILSHPWFKSKVFSRLDLNDKGAIAAEEVSGGR
ncbi:unnamed protein product, partial [Effrenium voratum]